MVSSFSALNENLLVCGAMGDGDEGYGFRGVPGTLCNPCFEISFYYRGRLLCLIMGILGR